MNQIVGSDKTFATPYHQQTNGLCERIVSTLANMLAHFAGPKHKNWDLYLNLALAAYRRTPQATTGETPHFLMFGRDPVEPYHLAHRIPAEEPISIPEWIMSLNKAWDLAVHNIKQAQEHQKEYYDAHRKEITFHAGDKVYLHNNRVAEGCTPKFAMPWHGPYRIVDVPGKGVYRITNMANPEDSQTVNVSRLKPAFEWLPLVPPIPNNINTDTQIAAPATTTLVPPSSIPEGQVEIEAILNDKTTKKGTYYQVKWKGKKGKKATEWLPAVDINAENLIKNYHRNLQMQEAALQAKRSDRTKGKEKLDQA